MSLAEDTKKGQASAQSEDQGTAIPTTGEHSKSHLRDTIEHHEGSTEELKASIEELQALNEELRRAGEEIGSGREELQSVNEELTAVNAEYKRRAEELARANSDLHNLMNATQIATVFLGRELQVMRFTPAAAPLFNLIPSDAGRPITDLNRRIEYPQMVADAEQVLRTLVPIERELRDNSRSLLARVLPYRTVEDHIGGVVLTFVDITERRRAEDALLENAVWIRGQSEALGAAVNGEPLQTSLGALVRTATEALGPGTQAAFYLSDNGRTALRHVVGMSAEYAEAVEDFKIGPELLGCGLAAHSVEPVLTTDVQTDPRWESWRGIADRFDYRGCWSFPIHTAAGMFVGTLAIYSQQPRETTARDLELASLLTSTASIILSQHQATEKRKRAEEALRESEVRLRAVLQQAPLAIAIIGPAGEILFRNTVFDQLWGRPAHDTSAKTYSDVYEGYHMDGRPVASEEWPGAVALLEGKVTEGEVLQIVDLSGRRIPCSFNAAPIRDEAGNITGGVVLFRDVSEGDAGSRAHGRGATHHATFSKLELFRIDEVGSRRP